MSALVDSTPSHAFTLLDNKREPIKSLLNRREQVLQYNLDTNLNVFRFRYSGTLSHNAAADYEDFIKDLCSASNVLAATGIIGVPDAPIDIMIEPLNMAVTSMDFFDRLQTCGIVGAGGKIKGCFQEIFNGVTVRKYP